MNAPLIVGLVIGLLAIGYGAVGAVIIYRRNKRWRERRSQDGGPGTVNNYAMAVAIKGVGVQGALEEPLLPEGGGDKPPM